MKRILPILLLMAALSCTQDDVDVVTIDEITASYEIVSFIENDIELINNIYTFYFVSIERMGKTMGYWIENGISRKDGIISQINYEENFELVDDNKYKSEHREWIIQLENDHLLLSDDNKELRLRKIQ